MSKRALKTYLQELDKEQLQEQILDLYHRFKEVKTYYDFSFNPKEEKLIADARFRISKEYFPPNGRRPKGRRSVAQKFIKHFMQIGMDPLLLADLMIYNVEVAQAFNATKPQKAEAFYKSMANSFEQAVEFVSQHGLRTDFQERLDKIVDQTIEQDWYNTYFFERLWSEGQG